MSHSKVPPQGRREGAQGAALTLKWPPKASAQLIDTRPSIYGNPNLAMVQNVVYDGASRMTSLQYSSAVVPNGVTDRLTVPVIDLFTFADD